MEEEKEMGSEAVNIPLIDLSSELKQGSPDWESMKKQVLEALKEYGCFELSVAEISKTLQESFFDGLKQLFDLPLENKKKNSSDRPYHGYIGGHDTPLYESLGIENPLTNGNVESFTNALWSHDNSTFSESVKSLSEKLNEVSQVVRRMVLDGLELKKYNNEHMNSTTSILRFMKYIGPQSHEEEEIALLSHTDKNILTILYQNEVSGLQILTKDGKWMNVDPSPNSFIILVGDVFHAWTNGWLYPPNHRVMMTGDVSRYSVGLFTVPKPGCTIKAPEELVDKEHPLLFKPFSYDEFMDFFSTEMSTRKSQVTLKTYCGA